MHLSKSLGNFVLDITAVSRLKTFPRQADTGPAGQPMNMACCLLVAAAAFTAWYRNEYIVVAHSDLLIGSSNSIRLNAYLVRCPPYSTQAGWFAALSNIEACSLGAWTLVLLTA